MVATPSTMLALGTKAPNFILSDTLTGKSFDFSKISNSKAHLICFICNHCPYVIHLLDHLSERFNQWHDQGISVLAISSNDAVKYPADEPLKMKELAENRCFRFPYLYDEDQSVAKNYRAACTPDFYLFDKNKKLFYRGQYDGSRPGNSEEVNGKDLNQAMNLLLNNQKAPSKQIPSLGCNIKWKIDNEPDYFGI